MTRITIDLTPEDYQTLNAWTRQASIDLDLPVVRKADVVRAMIRAAAPDRYDSLEGRTIRGRVEGEINRELDGAGPERELGGAGKAKVAIYISNDDLGLLVWCAMNYDRRLPGGGAIPVGVWEELTPEWKGKILAWRDTTQDALGAEVRAYYERPGDGQDL